MLARLFAKTTVQHQSTTPQNEASSLLAVMPADIAALTYPFLSIHEFKRLQSVLPHVNKHDEVYRFKYETYFPEKYAYYFIHFKELLEKQPEVAPLPQITTYWQDIFWKTFAKKYSHLSTRTRNLIHLAAENRANELKATICLQDISFKIRKRQWTFDEFVHPLLRVIHQGARNEPASHRLPETTLSLQNLLDDFFNEAQKASTSSC